jgi:hypothetical protein
MICETCFKMLRGQDGRVWRGTYDLNFNHHTQMKNLRYSAHMHCGICRVLFADLQNQLGTTDILPNSTSSRLSTNMLSSFLASWFTIQAFNLLGTFFTSKLLLVLPASVRSLVELFWRATRDSLAMTDDLPLSITASLRVGHQRNPDGTQAPGELYYLSFQSRCGHVRSRRIFALQQTGTNSRCTAWSATSANEDQHILGTLHFRRHSHTALQPMRCINVAWNGCRDADVSLRTT